MRCLLDKVTARRTLEGLLKIAEGRELSGEESFTLDLYDRAEAENFRLFISPPTANVLHFIAMHDQPMIQQWTLQYATIRDHLMAMQQNLPDPYRQALLPQVQFPQNIIFRANGGA